MPKLPKPAPAKTRIIVLRLSASLLGKFPSEIQDLTPSSPASSAVDSTIHAPASAAAADDTASNSPSNAPAANGLLAPGNPLKRKGIPGPKPGMKRTNSQLAIDGVPKPRGKPGPKKKLKIDGVNGTAMPISAPKLNPKANQGAINANLRALDRSGAACRKWVRQGFKVKSFTGVLWDTGAWSAGKRASTVDLSGDAKSETSAPSVAEAKQNVDSSAVASDKSVSGDGGTPMATMMAEAASSPAVAAA